MVDSPNNNNSETTICVDDDEKSRTFRKRRLTCVKHHLAAAAAEANDNSSSSSSSSPVVVVDGKSSRSCRFEPPKEEDDEPQVPTCSFSRSKKSKTTTTSSTSLLLLLPSRIVHAGQLHPPTTTTSSPKNRLYDAPFQHEPPVETEEDRASKPAWRHRHTHHPQEEDDTLPFPRHVVGTYSCHGVEPLYGSEYEEDDEEEDDEDAWVTTLSNGTASKHNNKDEQGENKLSSSTTVAKRNQDRGGIAYPYGNCPRTALFAVYDGHGQGGELVSQFALHEIQKRLERHALFHTNVEQAFQEIFISVDEDLTKEPLIDPLYAGTTACVVLIRDSQMTIANVGDSRAVLAKRITTTTTRGDDDSRGKLSQQQLVAINLSKDQNPDVPEEQKRIEERGGFVSPPPEVGLSARVWLDHTYSHIGLAMARSIGDHAVAHVGVIAEPVVTSHDIQKEDDFCIIATDGVWEFMDSEDAVRIVGEHLSSGVGATKACQALIEAAANKWHDEEGNYRDDITALVICLQDLWSSCSASK